MELRRISPLEATSEKDNETSPNPEKKESDAEASETVIGNGRKNGGLKENGHSILSSVIKIGSQIKKPPHRRIGSPLIWFPRKKADSFLKRKIRLLQEDGGMNLSLDETLGNASPHYTGIAREKIAAREAARKAMVARKAAMVEASWCRILRAARIQSKEAEAELEKAEKCAAEAFDAAKEKGVMMYDRPDCPTRPCEVESSSATGAGSSHTVTASFETSFEVDKEVMAAVKKAFIQLASFHSSSNREGFKDLLWKISQNPDIGVIGPGLSETSSEYESDLSGGEDERKLINDKYRHLLDGSEKSVSNSSKDLVTVMLERLKCLQEDELASLAGIVATCGLNAALLELENSKEREVEPIRHGTGARRNSTVGGFLDVSLVRKEPVTEVPSLDKFLVKHVSRLEREVQEARNSRCQQTAGGSEVRAAENKLTPPEFTSDLGSILVKHVSKLEKEVQEAKSQRKDSVLVKESRKFANPQGLANNIQQPDFENKPTPPEFTSDLGSILVKRVSKLEKEILEAKSQRKDSVLVKESRKFANPDGLANNIQQPDFDLPGTVSSCMNKENMDSNTLMPSSVVTDENHQAEEPTEINNGVSSVKHISRIERARLESQEQCSLDKILIKPVHWLEKEKLQALVRGSEYALQGHNRKQGAVVSASESLDKILVKHVSRLEREKLTVGAKESAITVKKPDLQLQEVVEGLDEILVKHQSKLEKAKLAAAQNPVDNIIINHRKQVAEVKVSESLDKLLVKHQPELEKANLAEAKQSRDYTIKPVNARREARERELQEAWGGLSLGNSVRPHLSRIEREKAAWKRAEEEEQMQRRGA